MKSHYSTSSVFGAVQGPPAQVDTAPTPTFWQQYGAEIVVGTITAVTGAIAVYLAMRMVEKQR